MTTHEMKNYIAKEVKTETEARSMWQRILKAYQKGKIGESRATDLGMWIEDRYAITL